MIEVPSDWNTLKFGDIIRVKYGRSLETQFRNEESQYPVVGSAGVMTKTSTPLVSNPALVIGRKGNVGSVQIFENGCYPIDTTYYMECPEGFNLKFLEYQLIAKELVKLDSSTATPSLRREDLEAVSLVMPPIAEQHQIVEILEDHLSRLDAAIADLNVAIVRCESLRKSYILNSIPKVTPAGWRLAKVKDAGELRLGRQRHPNWHNGPNMYPYLRVANVFEDRLELSDVMEMDFTNSFSQYEVLPGDVLLNEGQSPHLLGRSAIYRGELPQVAFTNTLIRFRSNPDVLADWAHLIFRHHMHSRRFMQESRITTNIAHLSLARLKEVEFYIPPIHEQEAIVERVKFQLDNVQNLLKILKVSRANAFALRRSLLQAALTGQLTREAIHV